MAHAFLFKLVALLLLLPGKVFGAIENIDVSSDVQVFLVAGQSNACGAGSLIKEFTSHPDDKQIYLSYKLLHNINRSSPDHASSWRESRGLMRLHPVTSGFFGAEIYFSRRYFQQTNKKGLAIVKVCAGSSKIKDHWWGSSGLLAQHAIPKLHQTMRQLRGRGLKPKLAGFIWLQGVSDAHKTPAQRYGNAFHSLLSSLRTRFGNSTMPFVLAKIHGGALFPPDHPNYQQIRKYQALIANCSAYGEWVYVDDAVLTDSIHWDVASHRTIGRRIANKMLQLVPRSQAAVQPIVHKSCQNNFLSFWSRDLVGWQMQIDRSPVETRPAVRAVVRGKCQDSFHFYKWYLDSIRISSCEF